MKIQFPQFTGIRCLMMPYIQGDPDSVPKSIREKYKEIIENIFLQRGEIGHLTIDESVAVEGNPHRGDRSKWGRALHTEAGKIPNGPYAWGSTNVWGGRRNVILDRNTKILLANNIDDSCAVWDCEHEDTSSDGDIGDYAEQYPYSDAILMKSGDVHEIGILTPHESLPVKKTFDRQFLRIVGEGVEGAEPYFTKNPILA